MIVVGPQPGAKTEGGDSLDSCNFPLESAPLRPGTPLCCVEILGQSVLGRLLNQVQRVSAHPVSILADSTTASLVPSIASSKHVRFHATEDPWRAAASAAGQILASEKPLFSNESASSSLLLVRASAYVELDFADMLQFHQEQGNGVTRAFDKEGPLDIWIVNASQLAVEDLPSALRSPEAARFAVRGYVNRLEHARDLRRLVVDGLTCHCHFRPQCVETRPGVWIEEGAQINRDARIVAPAYVGRGSRIEAQCLITRCSNIESNCQVDYGTVVEDSSVLTNSYVGIGLDLSHSIVEGSNLLNLEREVTLAIADPCVIRQNRLTRKDRNRRSSLVFGLGGAQFAQTEDRSG